MTCITFETLRSDNQDTLAGRGLPRAVRVLNKRSIGAAPQEPLALRLACAVLRLLMAPIRAHAERRDRARAYTDFRMIDVRTLDDIGLVRNHVAAVGTTDNENMRRGDVA